MKHSRLVVIFNLVLVLLLAVLAVLQIASGEFPALPLACLVLLQATEMTVLRNTLDCQGRGSWANIQIGYTTILLNPLWPRDPQAGAWLNLFLAAPARSASRDAGHERAHWGIWLSFRWRGRLVGPGYSWRADRSCCWIPPSQHYA